MKHEKKETEKYLPIIASSCTTTHHACDCVLKRMADMEKIIAKKDKQIATLVEALDSVTLSLLLAIEGVEMTKTDNDRLIKAQQALTQVKG